jgi:Zn-dependent M28 family amino/carboxypeptidase
VFLASTGEEKGLLGADYFATHRTVPGDPPIASRRHAHDFFADL